MDIFISYRRSNGIDIARSIWGELKRRGYFSFFDLDSIIEGEFPEVIKQNILRSNNFLILLTQNSLDSCVKEGDWVKKELACALKNNKNIIPIVCNGFAYPSSLPEDIDKIRFIQSLEYNGINFEELIQKIIERLKDEEGKSLKLEKKKNAKNLFYENEDISEKEKSRIRNDIYSCSNVEKEIFDRLLKDKKDLVLFAPAVYEIDSYMQKYDRKEIKHVFGLMNSEKSAAEANARYGERGAQRNRFYQGNMAHDDFKDEMDRILSENSIASFDVVDLTLILRDLEEPEKKLRQIVERVSPGGIIYVRELDHSLPLAYPDEHKLFEHMISLLKLDKYAGDFYAGQKVYGWLKNSDLVDIHFEGRQISTVGLKRRDKRILFDALFSYIENELEIMHEKEPTTELKKGLEWIREHYSEMESTFSSDDFFYSSGFMEFYAYVE